MLLVLIVAVAAIIARSVLGGGGTDESVSVQTGTVGQVITTKSDWSYRVTDVWTTRRVARGSRGARRYRQPYPAIARGRFVVVALRSRWRGDFEVDSGAQPAVLLAGDGKVYAERQTLARDFDRPYQAAEFDPNDVGGWGRDFTLEPGGTRSGVLVFEVPTRAVRGSRLELEPELGELVRIDLGI